MWKDTARVCGMPVLFENYKIIGETLYVQKGLLATKQDRILLYRVLDVEVIRGIMDRVLGTGTVVVYSADATDPTLRLTGVKNPEQVADMIQSLAEKAREKRGIAGREIYGAAGKDFVES